MVENIKDSLDRLMALSRDNSTIARRQLFDDVSSLFLSENDRLSEQERSYISDILSKLITEVETSVRQSLAKKLSMSNKAPQELVALLANDDIDVARPILFGSRLLMEPDLIQIISSRSKEHLLAITERNDISALVSDALIEDGDEDVLESLIRNADADISKTAMAFLVEESKRVDRFQEPLLARSDMPTELAHKMFWWVSAALRRHIINNFEIDQYFLDQEMSRTTREHLEDVNILAFGDTNADRLAAQLASKKELTEKFLVQTLKSRQTRLFVAGLSLKSGLDTQKISSFLFDKNAEAIAVICKSLDFDRNSFSAIYLLSRNGTGNGEEKKPISPDEIEKAMAFFDQLQSGTARSVLAHWKLENGYTDAIEQLDDQLKDQRVYL